jgi:hypothetical protein
VEPVSVEKKSEEDTCRASADSLSDGEAGREEGLESLSRQQAREDCDESLADPTLKGFAGLEVSQITGQQIRCSQRVHNKTCFSQ